MTRWLSFIALGAAGLFCGAVIGIITTAFVPNCGEPCAAEHLGTEAVWACALLVAFPLLGRFALKKTGNGLKQSIIVIGILSVITLAPAAAIYGYELHQRYWKTAWQQNIPNVDFSTMVIAIRPLKAVDYGTTTTVSIKAWERCALGVVSCDKLPRTVEAICFGSYSTVVIEESSWPALQRIPGEDLPGIIGHSEDMNLCSAR